MQATHCVIDSKTNVIGFIVNNRFYTDYYIAKNIDIVENLFVADDGSIKSQTDLLVRQYKDVIMSQYYELNSNNPFARDIQADLLVWKNDPLHKVGQVEGSRQIGKTTELLKFAYSQYEYVIYITLASDIFHFEQTILESGINPLVMEKYCRQAGLPHYEDSKNTLLIIDEIQISAKVYNCIRAFDSELKCDVIVTGSYLGRILSDKSYFLPAGTISSISMFPLSFTEFCRIFDYEQKLLTLNLFGKSELSDYDELGKLYEVYRQIGGYPEVVKMYLKDKNAISLEESVLNCQMVIEKLLAIFEEESRNYFSDYRDTMIFETIYTEAAKEMCSEKRGTGNKYIDKLTNIANQSRNSKTLVSREEVLKAIEWLIYSGIIGRSSLYVNGDRRNISPSRRTYYLDCGVANYASKLAALPESDKDGLLTETFAYSELLRLFKKQLNQRHVSGTIPCFSTYGDYELDFMIPDADELVYGIEVKTNSGDPKSLKTFLDKKLVDKGIVAKKTIGGHGEKFDTIPIYTVGVRFPYKDADIQQMDLFT